MRSGRHRGRVVCAAVLATVVLRGGGARAAWTVDERGECVERWTPASLGRGPTAMLNAPLAPVRSAVGGVQLALNDPNAGMESKILLPPLLAVAGGAVGLVECVVWLGGGLADTVTGGWFAIAPDEATTLSVAPITPAFAPAAQRPPAAPTDRCGNPTQRPR